MLAPKVVKSANKDSSDIGENSETKDGGNTTWSERPKLTSEQLEKLFSKMDLSGLKIGLKESRRVDP